MSRRHNRVSPLTLVLPQPSLPQPRRRSSLLSLGSASSSSAPRTPRSSCAGATCASWVLNPSNRNSTDSWNSSNNDFGDDADTAEWKNEHILLLQRTLDALPSHLLTPYGPVPPANLLNKIAQGVAERKGPVEWPFSLRATRVKLAELARAHVKDSARAGTDENATRDLPAAAPRKRPVPRQSSMDFLYGAITEDQDDVASINRLSARLQRTSDFIPTTQSTYHPYSRTAHSLAHRRSSSPSRHGLSPGTPSTSTLNTLSSMSSSSRSHNRRSGATLSSMTSNESMSSLGMADARLSYALLPSSMACAPDPRVQRVRRSESFCAPPPSSSKAVVPPSTPVPARQTVKRAPSYGALAQESKDVNRARAANDGIILAESPVDLSSDEEEKVRSKHVKKARTRTGFVPSPASSIESPPASPEYKKTPKKCKDRKTASPCDRPRMSLQRNPSMFGAELPHLQTAPAIRDVAVTYEPPASDTPKKTPTLRRVKRMGLAPSRRISFGASTDMGNEADMEGLAGAFQMK